MGDVFENEKGHEDHKKGFSFAIAIIVISPGLTYCIV